MAVMVNSIKSLIDNNINKTKYYNMRKTIEQLKLLRESEDKVEFKKGEGGNISYNGGNKPEPSKRRRCILGYVTALCNEGGGSLVIGMHDDYPHAVIGTTQNEGSIGELESKIYNDTFIRVDIYELYEDEKRVLVIDVPARPAGRVFKFEDVPLMRVGEELKPMSDEVHLKIMQEQEPDFSEQFCEGLSIDDLDSEAVSILKAKYARKQKNLSFESLSDEQALSDLHLIVGTKVTNAALILLGKEEVIQQRLPQSKVMLEYRTSESQIHFNHRDSFAEPFYIMIDKLWNAINARNGSIPIREGAYQSNSIPLFNEDVIREAINNAIAHRNYKMTSETVIKQYPNMMEIVSSGGFPYGVTLENLLTVPSTPRNRLLADVLAKTGIVERSGQGIDKIFLNTLSEGKLPPDYSKSDVFYVSLLLSAQIEDAAFAQFIMNIQDLLDDANRLTAFDVITLNDIRIQKDKKLLDKNIVAKLLKGGYIESRGKTSGVYYILSKDYFELAGNIVEYSKKSDWDINQAFSMVTMYLNKHHKAKMGEFEKLFEGHLNRRQTKSYIEKMVDGGLLTPNGVGSGTYYILSDNYKERMEVFSEIIKLGVEAIQNKTL